MSKFTNGGASAAGDDVSDESSPVVPVGDGDGHLTKYFMFSLSICSGCKKKSHFFHFKGLYNPLKICSRIPVTQSIVK